MTKILQSKPFLAVLAAIFFIGHFAFQFFAWAQHPGNSAVAGQGSALSWFVSSFPLFAVLGSSLTTQFFWAALVANSVIWSVGLTWITAFSLRKVL
jgi:hypothetical protein